MCAGTSVVKENHKKSNDTRTEEKTRKYKDMEKGEGKSIGQWAPVGCVPRD